MIVRNNPDINVEEIMAKIRAEIANRKNSPAALPQRPLAAVAVTDWANVMSHLSIAEQNAEIGSRQLQMAQYPRSIRWLARLSGRIVMYVSQVVTIPQRKYNLASLQAFRLATNSLKAMETRLTEQDQRLVACGTKLAEQEHQISNLQSRLLDSDRQISTLQEDLTQTKAEVGRNKTTMAQQEHRLGLLLEEARRRLPKPFNEEQIQTFVDADEHLFDSYYLNLEDRFRGSRDDVKERIRVYLSRVKEAEAGGPTRPVLDLGCGRGEWLELLKEDQMIARGVDLNAAMVNECRNRELEVVHGDVFEYLNTLPDQSMGAVTAFHLIEHLPFRLQIKLLDEAGRVLKSGGIAIFETPNPENLQVGSCSFHLDPTHRRPLPPMLLRFMAEQRGFCRIEVLPLHTYPADAMIPQDGSDLAARANHFFYGPQDYAVIGYKL